jgi:predicted membrane protein
MRSLLDWLSGLPIRGTTAFVAGLATLVTALVWSATRNRTVRWTAVLVGPFAVAWCVYSLPTRYGADRSELAAWEGVFMSIWGLAGLCASTVLALFWNLLTRRRANHQA